MTTPKKILIIDDDELFADAVSKILRDKGYETIVFNKGTLGLAALLENKFDVALLDIIMPDKNGMELIKEVSEKNKDISNKIIMMTSLSDYGCVTRALEYGVKNYVEKNESTHESIANVVENKLKELV